MLGLTEAEPGREGERERGEGERERGEGERRAKHARPTSMAAPTAQAQEPTAAGAVTEANGATEFFPRSHLVYTRQETDLHQTRAADGNTPSHPSRRPNRTERRRLNLLAC